MPCGHTKIESGYLSSTELAAFCQSPGYLAKYVMLPHVPGAVSAVPLFCRLLWWHVVSRHNCLGVFSRAFGTFLLGVELCSLLR
jgi:hypothetical protein